MSLVCCEADVAEYCRGVSGDDEEENDGNVVNECFMLLKIMQM